MPGWSATARLVKIRLGRTFWSELVSRTHSGLNPHTYELILSHEIEPPDIEVDA